jgi:hypothetical protein
MDSDRNLDSPDIKHCEPGAEGRRAAAEDQVPLSVRKARQMPRDLWPSLWMSFASMVLLAVALAILSYRMGTQSCH